VAHNGTHSQRQDGSGEKTITSNDTVADGVDAAVYAMQATGPQPVLDRPSPEVKISKLPIRHHAVLSGGQIRHLNIRWVAFCMYAMRYASHLTRLAALRCCF
jgi:hypothetical protein